MALVPPALQPGMEDASGRENKSKECPSECFNESVLLASSVNYNDHQAIIALPTGHCNLRGLTVQQFQAAFTWKFTACMMPHPVQKTSSTVAVSQTLSQLKQQGPKDLATATQSQAKRKLFTIIMSAVHRIMEIAFTPMHLFSSQKLCWLMQHV